MQIGDLNKRVEFQAPTKASDGMLGFTVTWSTIITVWAAIWPLNSTERLANMQAGGTLSGKVRIRYSRTPFRTGWRIKYGNRYLNIEGLPVVIGNNDWLEFMVSEI